MKDFIEPIERIAIGFLSFLLTVVFFDCDYRELLINTSLNQEKIYEISEKVVFLQV